MKSCILDLQEGKKKRIKLRLGNRRAEIRRGEDKGLKQHVGSVSGPCTLVS